MVSKSGSSFIAFGVVGSKNLDGGVAGEPLGVVSVCTDEPSMVGHESLDSVRPLVFSASGPTWEPREPGCGGRLSCVSFGGQEPCLCMLWVWGVPFLRWLRRELVLFSWDELPLDSEDGGLFGLPAWLGVDCPWLLSWLWVGHP